MKQNHLVLGQQPMVYLVFVASIFICATAIVEGHTQQSKATHSSKIAFASNRDGNLEIYTMNPGIRSDQGNCLKF